LIDAGFTVECIAPGTAYRVEGGDATAFAENLEAPLTLALEYPPTTVIDLRSTLAPALAFRRTIYVHGGGEAFRYVARAVDARLVVTTVGICRWAVTGRTADLMSWQAEHVHCVPVEEVLKLWAMTPEMVLAEDVDQTPTPIVHITLPDRKTTSEITRDYRGDITHVVQLETDA
jgi:hypothetical protein